MIQIGLLASAVAVLIAHFFTTGNEPAIRLGIFSDLNE